MKSIEIEQKSMIIDNHKKECDRFSIFFDWLILILSITIDFYGVSKLSICNALEKLSMIKIHDNLGLSQIHVPLMH